MKHRSSPTIILSPPSAQQNQLLTENIRHVRRRRRIAFSSCLQRWAWREDYRRLVLCCHTGNRLRAALESRVTIKAHPKPVRVTSSPTLPYRPKSGGWVGLSALSIYATNCNFNTRDLTSTENQYRLSKRSPVLSRVRSSCLQAPQTEVHSTTTCRSKYQICVTTTTIPRWRSYVHEYIYSTRRAALPDMQGRRK